MLFSSVWEGDSSAADNSSSDGDGETGLRVDALPMAASESGRNSSESNISASTSSDCAGLQARPYSRQTSATFQSQPAPSMTAMLDMATQQPSTSVVRPSISRQRLDTEPGVVHLSDPGASDTPPPLQVPQPQPSDGTASAPNTARATLGTGGTPNAANAPDDQAATGCRSRRNSGF